MAILIAFAAVMLAVCGTASALTCDCDVCVSTFGWWRDGGVRNGSDTPIQAAVDNATAGETIGVAAGDYHENVDVNKRLMLVGEGADVVNVTNSAANHHVFEVTADYVNISGFNVIGATNYGKAGIQLSGRQHCNISDNTASGNYYGIYLSSSSNNTLLNNTANSNRCGILLSSSSNYNTLLNNTADSNRYYGIYLPYSSNNTLLNNTANSNSYGILLSSSSNYNTLLNNTANLNGMGGIDLYYSSNNTLLNNTADSNTDGIYLYYSSNNTLSSNTADSNRYHGIYLYYSSSNTLSSNTADSNRYGIDLYYSSNNTLLNNTADSNRYYGIYLHYSSDNTLLNNTANSNSYGILMSSSSNYNTLLNNTANLNGMGGIDLYYSSNNTLLNNTADSNRYYGIYLHYSSNTLLNNTASDNSNWDIYIVDSPSTFADNTLDGTTVSFTYSGDVSLKGVGSPAADPSGQNTIGKFINATNQSAGAWLYLNFSYSDSDVSGLDESSLAVWKHNGTDWLADGWNGTRYPDEGNNTVGVNITTFSVFAPMAPTAAAAYIPHDPTNLINTTDNYRVNYTWTDSEPGNVTDSYNVRMNGTWTNGTTATFMNVTVGPSRWANISVWAYNASGGGTLSAGSISGEVQAPAAPAAPAGAPNITSRSNNKTNNDSTTITINESESVRFNATANSPIDEWHWHNNGTFVQSNNFDNYATSWDVNGAHTVSVNVTNANGTSSPVTWAIIVTDITAPAQVMNLTNDTPTARALNLSWTANTEADLVGYRVYRNGTLLGSTANAYYNVTSLDPSTTYEFNVSTYDDNGLEGENASIVVTTAVVPLDHIDVMPTSLTLNITESVNFNATGFDHNNDSIDDLVFGWESSNPYAGSLNDSTGIVVVFTAEHVGITYLTARNGSVTSDQVQVTVNAGTNNTSVTNETSFTVASGDANVAGSFNNNVSGWVSATALGNVTASAEVNQSNPRLGLESGDKVVSGVIVNVNDDILNELSAGNGTIHIEICYNATTLVALGIDASTLAIWKYNNTTEKWVNQPSTRSGTCVYVDVNHLCTFGLVGSKATGDSTDSTDSTGGGGGEGTYPPEWFETPTPAVTATKAPASSATGTTTDAPPSDKGTPAPTRRPAAAKTTAPVAEGTTAETVKKGAPGFTAVFVIAGTLAIACAMMRRRE